MTVVLERTPADADANRLDEQADAGAVVPARRLIVLAALASLAAGVIHSGAIAGHAPHRQAVWAFLGVAVVQLAWGAYALARPRRWLAGVGVAIGVVVFAGWVLAKTRGLTFIDGLDVKEPVRGADAIAAGLAFVTVVSGLLALVVRRRAAPRAMIFVAAAAMVAMVVPGTAGAVNHPHAGTVSTVAAEPASAVPPRPFDPALPIDLSGVPGVTPEQQARAENLLASTVMLLPKWSDPAFDTANGFVSIHDGGSGTEHYVNPAFMADDTILDPNKPESLVFDTRVSPKRLVAAMYMMTPGATLADVPDLGGALTQWHIHNNLCFTAEGRVAGLTQGDGSCAANLFKGPETPMIHVWIEPHPCGPFAALEGVGGGQVADGQPVACDHLHGS